MLRSILAMCSAIAFSVGTASAETPLERGSYLVNSIMACGNCHTPKDAVGEPIADKELAGGLSFSPPPFTATASNITADLDTGIRPTTKSNVQLRRGFGRAMVGFQACRSRRSWQSIFSKHFYRETLMPWSYISARLNRCATRSLIRSIKRRFTMTHTPMQRRDSLKRHYAIQFAGALTWSRSDIAWSVIRRERKAFQIT
jgi:hypothetical protein